MAEEAKKEEKFEMEYRMLGGSGLKVSALGLGTMSFNSEDQAVELMEAVRSYGVNFFDNAEFYGEPCGTADVLFGNALKKLQKKDPALWRRSDLVITDKIFMGPGDGKQPNIPNRTFGANDIGLSRKRLREGMDGCLERLQLEYVDVVYAHRYDHMTPMEEIVRGFTDIIKAGKAFYWGTSMWTPQKITEAYWIAKINNLIPPIVEQPQYNMFARQNVEWTLLPMFKAPYSIGTTVWSPLDGGLLTGKYVDKDKIDKDSRMGGGDNRLGKWWSQIDQDKNGKVAKLMEIAKEIDVSMVSLALGWTLKNKNVSVCLLGGRKAEQLLQNKEAITAAMKMNKDIMAKIETILDNKPKPPPRSQFRFQHYITDPQ